WGARSIGGQNVRLRSTGEPCSSGGSVERKALEKSCLRLAGVRRGGVRDRRDGRDEDAFPHRAWPRRVGRCPKDPEQRVRAAGQGARARAERVRGGVERRVPLRRAGRGAETRG